MKFPKNIIISKYKIEIITNIEMKTVVFTDAKNTHIPKIISTELIMSIRPINVDEHTS